MCVFDVEVRGAQTCVHMLQTASVFSKFRFSLSVCVLMFMCVRLYLCACENICEFVQRFKVM